MPSKQKSLQDLGEQRQAGPDNAPGEPPDRTTSVPQPSRPAFAFKKVKAVAVQMFKLQTDETRYFLVDAPMFTGKEVAKSTMGAPTILPVTDLETGEEGQTIIGKVLVELIHEHYPNGTYVGKKFAVTPRKKADKKYNTYDFTEIEV